MAADPAPRIHQQPESVNDALTASRRAERGPSQRQAAGPGVVLGVENTGYAARVIRGHARRIAEGDVDGLADLLIWPASWTSPRTAVEGLRTFGYPWSEIATRLGATRQAAQQRWGR